MKKKLDSRFPAARIKKIMQADEDVGKIALAVPLLVSKALELFLQDLCDRTYEITLQKGAKTLNSMHLKECVQSFNVFDFLREIVGKVPNLGGSDAPGEDRSATKRRKVADDDNHDSDEANRGRPFQPQTVHINESGGRGRGRGTGRGRGRPRKVDKEAAMMAAFTSEKNELDPVVSRDNDNIIMQENLGLDYKETHLAVDPAPARNFDLNLDLDENGDTPPISLAPVTPGGSSTKPNFEMKPEEYPGWSMADMEKMAIGSIRLGHLNSTVVDEEEEDYDEEE
uniref:dr1-associated corepressor-like n=1 Tax=Erigeron canadensis TaxID=72917 RepID=UPI001CB93107|nr:dr1-associated corepressor-like [Erigeron canadensis]